MHSNNVIWYQSYIYIYIYRHLHKIINFKWHFYRLNDNKLKHERESSFWEKWSSEYALISNTVSDIQSNKSFSLFSSVATALCKISATKISILERCHDVFHNEVRLASFEFKLISPGMSSLIPGEMVLHRSEIIFAHSGITRWEYVRALERIARINCYHMLLLNEPCAGSSEMVVW